jgi:SAM-dependent methyltransferase
MPRDWETRYQKEDMPWDSGRPSDMLVRLIEEETIRPCRALELGSGTGTNAIHLARLGFDMTGVDISAKAIELAKAKAADAGIAVRWIAGDLLRINSLGEPFDFVFDRGCYHCVREETESDYVEFLRNNLKPDGQALILAGNDREPKAEHGPPVVSEAEIRDAFRDGFKIDRLEEFRFQTHEGETFAPLAWMILLRRTG